VAAIGVDGADGAIGAEDEGAGFAAYAAVVPQSSSASMDSLVFDKVFSFYFDAGGFRIALRHRYREFVNRESRWKMGGKIPDPQFSCELPGS
jgi:hypothetical protein